MLSEVLKHPRALVLSAVFHILLVGAILINLTYFSQPERIQPSEQVETIKAEIVDQKLLDDRARKQKQDLEAERKKLEEKKRQAEAETKQHLELKKEEAEKKAAAKEVADQKAEASKKEALKRKAEAQQKKEQAELERKQQEQVEKRERDRLLKLEQEKNKKLAEEKRLRDEKLAQEAEQKRRQLELEKQKAEQRRLADEEQKRIEAELKLRLKAEENNRRLTSLRAAYIQAIREKVERNWRRPQESGKIPSCEVRVVQGPGGLILDVSFGACKGGTAAYRASIENAVYKAEPLPKPGDDALFEREIIFLFNPE